MCHSFAALEINNSAAEEHILDSQQPDAEDGIGDGEEPPLIKDSPSGIKFNT